MKHFVLIALISVTAATAGCKAASNGGGAASAHVVEAATDVVAEQQELDWLEMMPAEELKALEDGDVPEVNHDQARAMPQFGTFRTVNHVLGRSVRLPGYVVPLENEADGRLREFLFVPYYGACIHVPPPPPNQIVHVRLAQGIPMPDMYSPFFLTGKLAAERFDDALAGSAYTMQDAGLKPYEN
ncbi:DUF3299 domain-containing protein [Stenotrophomonas tumulicola]|uniref:DUF3299 domain-containing protein n=1 Tax=Stenotrophomonas tumulicola TaxID=1685415 RepID=A0A7W3FJQ8_9GAMM|nr:DUF3299 domain-containing protein [Stenotrophomonas tumulicola]MBA8680730.1 DUF3299 domain-containing protein [Stenotrophomonas tumulicola]